MFIKRFCIFLFVLAVSFSCEAQVIVFNSLEDIWKYADTHNISVLTAKYELTKSIYSKKQSYGALLPQINATGSFTDNISLQTTLIPAQIFGGAAGTYKTLQFGQQYVYAGGISAQMNILNLQNWFNVQIAKRTEEMNDDSLAATRKTMYQQIATQYYSYLLMKEAESLAVRTAGIADSVFQLTENKFNEGTVNEANVDNAKLNFERAQQSQITAYYQMLTAQNNIKGLLGLTVKDSIRFDETLQSTMNIDVSATFQEDPSIKLALQKAQISLSQYKYANSAFAPTINILYSYNDQRYDNSFEPFTNAKGTTAWFPAQYWGLQAVLPIFTGGSRWYQSKKNKIAYDESLALYENSKKQADINDENLRLNYQKAAAVLDKAKDVMELSFDNYRHISYRYDAGVESLDAKLNAFKDYIDYQNQYLSSLSDMLVQLYQTKIRQQSF